MRRLSLRAFTLVELLVVITIIGMLMGLLLPAVQSARESGRRAVCMSNQNNLGTAMLNYEAAQRRFPGQCNTISGTATLNVGWTVVLMPFMEHSDIWKQWLQGNQSKTFVKILVCPSDPPDQVSPGDVSLAYSVNYEVCRDNDTTTAGCPSSAPHYRPLSLDYVSSQDGASMTALLSENVRKTKVHYWTDLGTGNTGTAQTGCADGNTAGAYLPNTASTYTSSKLIDKVGFIGFKNGATKDGTKFKDFLGSNHGGGAIVTFCDKHTQFVRDDIDGIAITPSNTTIFQHMCSPDGTANVVPDESWWNGGG